MKKRLMSITGVVLIALLAVAGSGLARRGPGRLGGGMGMAVCLDVPEALGLTIDEYINARREGKSIAELAKAQGLTLDDLKEKLLEKQRAFLAGEAAAGRISEARAAYTLEVMEERLDLCLQDGGAAPFFGGPRRGANSPGRRMAPFRGGMARRGPGPFSGPTGMGVFRDIPEALGLTIEEYIDARREGKSIPELAEDRGWTLADLKAKLLERPRAFIEEQLAAGRISEAKAVYMLELIEERLDLRLQDRGAGRPMFRGPGLRCRWCGRW